MILNPEIKEKGTTPTLKIGGIKERNKLKNLKFNRDILEWLHLCLAWIKGIQEKHRMIRDLYLRVPSSQRKGRQ
jgi:hypothetical protein